ncbi:S-adenosylmethionine-dependent methyltransferase [Pseudogymnoascus destructans]|uniref:S-adenosylmethionine-dependent methyltransferase n=2 Tax=Pseudogymnoascus destructans TaxID=655981 RepID=L8GB83_PSED2|nr:S-adenosylmethionine-dependent methyltransferase [Pseudogymnoascus destructans]ELR10342.1 hypothetical protein GMDG_04724 [Pseudogymnoascus destructans 20631-21]OAF56000.1 S-adenosylmethionine-dependent methyltransferase [Pseudogymnoascus destructans]
MLDTPDTAHVPFTHIYEPAEDSYLLLDTFSSPPLTSLFRSLFPISPPSPSPLILEIGTGSGVVLAFLTAHASTIFGRPDVLAWGVDINEHACRATRETVAVAVREAGTGGGGTYIGNCVGDLTSAVEEGSVDVLVFNPPYVPTPDVPALQEGDGDKEAPSDREVAYERESRLLALSYAGGRDGMEVTDRLLAEIPRVLSQRGSAFVLLCAQNKPEDVMKGVRVWEGGWEAEVVGRSGMKGGWEKLVVVRIWRVSGGE